MTAAEPDRPAAMPASPPPAAPDPRADRVTGSSADRGSGLSADPATGLSAAGGSGLSADRGAGPNADRGAGPNADQGAELTGHPRPAVESVGRQVDLLVNQIGHWTAPRWTAPADSGRVRRSDLVHRLVQQLADLAAEAEGQPRRSVPRLENDLALPDQLRVVATDLVLAGPPPTVLAEAATVLTTARQAL